MKTVLALLVLCLTIASAVVAASGEGNKVYVIRSVDGAIGKFRIFITADAGLWVNSADGPFNSPMVMLKWEKIDLGHLKTTQPGLYDLYSKRGTLGGNKATQSVARKDETPRAGALPPLPPRAVSLDVQLQQVGTSTSTPWQTNWGSYRKEYSAQRALRVRLKIFGNFDPRVTVEWRFVAKRIEGGIYVYDHGKSETVIGKPESVIGIHGKPVSGEDSKYVALEQRNTSGGKPYGYAVRVIQGGKVVAKMESSAGLFALPLPRERSK